MAYLVLSLIPAPHSPPLCAAKDRDRGEAATSWMWSRGGARASVLVTRSRGGSRGGRHETRGPPSTTTRLAGRAPPAPCSSLPSGGDGGQRRRWCGPRRRAGRAGRRQRLELPACIPGHGSRRRHHPGCRAGADARISAARDPVGASHEHINFR
jgi:hypothetical protein